MFEAMKHEQHECAYIRRSSPFVHTRRCEYIVDRERRTVCYRAASVSPSVSSTRRTYVPSECYLKYIDRIKHLTDSGGGYSIAYRNDPDSPHVSYDYSLYGYDDKSPVYKDGMLSSSDLEEGHTVPSSRYILDKIEPRRFIDLLNSDIYRWSDGETPDTVVTKLQTTTSPALDLRADVFDKGIDEDISGLEDIYPHSMQDEPDSTTTLLNLPLDDLQVSESVKCVRSPVRSLFGAIRGLRRRMRDRSQDPNTKCESSPIITHRTDSKLRIRLRDRSNVLPRPEDEGTLTAGEESHPSGSPVKDIDSSVAYLFDGVLPDVAVVKSGRPKVRDYESTSVLKVPKSILAKLQPKEYDNTKTSEGVASVTYEDGDKAIRRDTANQTLNDTVQNYVMPVGGSEIPGLFLQRYQQRHGHRSHHIIPDYPFKVSSDHQAGCIDNLETFRDTSPQLHVNMPCMELPVVDTTINMERGTYDMATVSVFGKDIMEVTQFGIPNAPLLVEEERMPSNIELSRLISSMEFDATADDFTRQMTTICTMSAEPVSDAYHSDSDILEPEGVSPSHDVGVRESDESALVSPRISSMILGSMSFADLARPCGQPDDTVQEILPIVSAMDDKSRVSSIPLQDGEGSLVFAPMRSMEDAGTAAESVLLPDTKSPSIEIHSRFNASSFPSDLPRLGSVQVCMLDQITSTGQAVLSSHEAESTNVKSSTVPVLRIDTRKVESTVELRLQKTLSHKDVFHTLGSELVSNVEPSINDHPLLLPMQSDEIRDEGVPSDLDAVSQYPPVGLQSSFISLRTSSINVDGQQISKVPTMEEQPSAQMQTEPTSASSSMDPMGLPRVASFDASDASLINSRCIEPLSNAGGSQIAPSQASSRELSTQASMEPPSEHEVTANWTIPHAPSRSPSIHSIHQSSGLGSPDTFEGQLQEDSMDTNLQSSRMDRSPTSITLSTAVHSIGLNMEDSLEKHLLPPSNKVWNEGVEEAAETLPLPLEGSAKQYKVTDVPGATIADEVKGSPPEETSSIEEGAGLSPPAPTEVQDADPDLIATSVDDSRASTDESMQGVSGTLDDTVPVASENSELVASTESFDHTVTEQSPEDAPSMVSPGTDIDKPADITGKEDEPSDKKKKKKKKHKDGDKAKSEKKKRKEKKHKKELDTDRPRPLRHLVDKQLKEGFKATVYIVSSKKNATSSLCTVKFDYDADRLIFVTPSNTFDIDGSKVAAEEIPTLPGAPILLKLTVQGRKSSVVVIQSTCERNLNVLGGTVGWAKTTGQESKLGDRTNSSGVIEDTVEGGSSPSYKVVKDADTLLSRGISSDKHWQDNRKKGGSNSGKTPSKRSKQQATPDPIPEESAADHKPPARVEDKESGGAAGSSRQKRGLVSRLLLRKRLSNTTQA